MARSIKRSRIGKSRKFHRTEKFVSKLEPIEKLLKDEDLRGPPKPYFVDKSLNEVAMMVLGSVEFNKTQQNGISVLRRCVQQLNGEKMSSRIAGMGNRKTAFRSKVSTNSTSSQCSNRNKKCFRCNRDIESTGYHSSSNISSGRKFVSAGCRQKNVKGSQKKYVKDVHERENVYDNLYNRSLRKQIDGKQRRESIDAKRAKARENPNVTDGSITLS